MRRKAAFVFALIMTAALTILRLGLIPGWQSVQVGPLNAEYLLIVLVAVAVIVIFGLCFSRKEPLRVPQGGWASVGGWICTFTGAVLALSILMDTVCWLVYGQIPPPNSVILNPTDHIALICTLLFGLVGGVFLAWQGFCWMSRDNSRQTVRGWLSLAPVLWLWFRLARYEVSYASTIDIGENFFDFAILIFALLFFLQLARFLAKVSRPPRSGLPICALCTAMIALSDAPVTISGIAAGEPLGRLLIAIVDAVIGAFALYMAVLQIFAAPAEEADDDDASADDADTADGLAWTEQPAEQPPLDPPFVINRVMPQTDALTKADAEDASDANNEIFEADQEPATDRQPDMPAVSKERSVPQTDAPAPVKRQPEAPRKALTVDDLLDEIDKI